MMLIEEGKKGIIITKEGKEKKGRRIGSRVGLGLVWMEM